MVQDQEARVVQTLRAKLGNGHSIAIIGWRDSNHDSFTRALPMEQVRFFETAPLVMPRTVGYALFTNFVDHNQTKRVREQVSAHTKLFNTGCIKRILRDAATIKAATNKPESQEKAPMATPATTTAMPQDVAMPQSKPLAPSSQNGAAPYERTREEKGAEFALDFMKAVGDDPVATLSKYEVNKVLRRHFGESATASHFGHLLEPVVNAGNTKAGSYKATVRLLELVTGIDVEPKDPIEKARWLISRGPKLEERRSKLQLEIQAIDSELERVKKADQLLDSLKTL